MINAILRGKLDAENPQVRFGEGVDASARPSRGARLYKVVVAFAALLLGFTTSAALLPSGYQEVEWIESTGKQSVDLGFVIDANKSVFVMKFNSGAGKSPSVYFGTAYNFNCYLFLQQNNVYRFYGAGGALDFTPSSRNDNCDMTITIVPYGNGRGDVTLDCPTGSNWTTATLKNTSTMTQSGVNLHLFSDSNGSYNSAFRFYRLTVTENDVVVHDFIPCYRVSDGAIGLYDVCVADASSAFRTDAKGTEVFGKGPAVTYGDKLTVTGVPDEYGTVDPAYGKTVGQVTGRSYTLTAPASWTSDDGLTRTVCTGCTVTVVGGDVIASKPFSGEGDTRSITYTHPDCPNGVEAVWQWEVQNKVAVATAGSGTVTTKGDWVVFGDSFTVTATPDAGSRFLQWGDRETGETLSTDPTLTITVERPRQVSAVFVSGTIPYDPSIKDYSSIIQSVIGDAEEDDVITFEDGTYTFSQTLTVEKGITLTGSHRDKCILMGDGVNTMANALVLNDAGACVKCLTISNVLMKASFSATDACVYIKAGQLTEARVTGCRITNVNGNNTAGVVLDSDPAKKVEAFLTNCQIDHNDGSQGQVGGVNFKQGGVMLNCLVWANTGKGTGGVRVAPSGYKFAKVVNCTIVGNAGGDRGGGLDISPANFGVLYDCGPWIVNTIIAGNTSTADGRADISFQNDRCRTDTGFNCLCPTVSDFGVGQQKGDPLFVSPDTGDYRLQPSVDSLGYSDSPAYNNGDKDKAKEVLEYEAGQTYDLKGMLDFYGNCRILKRQIDIGCAEFKGESGLLLLVR